MFKFKHLSKSERSWVLYDVANSAFVLTVITVLFPLLSKHIALSEGYGATKVSSTFMYLTAGIALVVAILSPLVGAAANYRGNKSKFFKMFLFIGIAGGIGIAVPGLSWVTLLTIFVIASIGYNSTNVIYDAFLVDVTEEENMDSLSAFGFAWGYIGSMIPFFIGLIPFALVTFGILDGEQLFNVGTWSFTMYNLTISFAFIVSCIWWFYYSLPMIKNVKQKYDLQEEEVFKKSLSSLVQIFKDFKKYKDIFIYMLAYLLYIDVVNSVIRLATTIGGDLKVSDTMLLAVVVIVQFVAFPCALLFGRLTKRFGAKRMIYYGIFMYTLTILVVYNIHESTTWLMLVVAVLVGSAQGGIQAVSRSYFARMVPREKANEFFGFFSVFGRFAGIFSPFLLASLYTLGFSVNTSVLFLLIPLALGSVLLYFVPNLKQQ
ncbi:MFS transporter [Mycoplasmatota bacterium]|nr:MFS transporter [Mycoplasmatota bacterium]